MDILKNEAKALRGLSVLGIKNEEIIKYLRLQVHPGEETYALDIRNSAINVSISTYIKYLKKCLHYLKLYTCTKKILQGKGVIS